MAPNNIGKPEYPVSWKRFLKAKPAKPAHTPAWSTKQLMKIP
jgi:hypothetical protein